MSMMDKAKKLVGIQSRGDLETELAKVVAGQMKVQSNLDTLRANLATQEANLAVAEAQAVVDGTKVEGVAKMQAAIENLKAEIARGEKTLRPIQERKSQIVQRLIEMDYGDMQRELAKGKTERQEWEKRKQALHEELVAGDQKYKDSESREKNVIVPGLRAMKERVAIACDYFQGTVEQFIALTQTVTCTLCAGSAAKLLKEWREPIRFMTNNHLMQGIPAQAMAEEVYAVWIRATGELRLHGVLTARTGPKSVVPVEKNTWFDIREIARRESHVCGGACPNEAVQERKALLNILAPESKPYSFTYHQ